MSAGRGGGLAATDSQARAIKSRYSSATPWEGRNTFGGICRAEKFLMLFDQQFHQSIGVVAADFDLHHQLEQLRLLVHREFSWATPACGGRGQPELIQSKGALHLGRATVR